MNLKKKVLMNCIILILLTGFMIYITNQTNVFAASAIQKNFDSAYNSLATLTKKITSFLLGIAIVSGFATLIYHLIRLGAAGGNPQARAKVLQDMFTTVICISLLGSFSIVVSLIVILLKT